MAAFAYAVALTGGIATGKSSTAKIFSEKGFRIIDADKIAHQVLDTQAAQVATLFGTTYLTKGRIDRKALGRLIFSDAQKRKALESLLHPLIQKEIASLSEMLDRKKSPYLVDIPLFFESDAYPITETIVVYAPKGIQIRRLMQREGYTQEEALQRISAQMDIEAKKAQATYVIDNSGDRDQLARECQRVRHAILVKNWL